MRNVAITTSVSISNYGTKLQAYAICEIFKKRGYSPVILEYSKGKELNAIRKAKKAIGKVLKPILYGKDYKLKNKFHHEYKINDIKLQKSIIQRYKAIDSDDGNIPHTRFMGSEQALKRHASKYQLFVTGSDQVWHPVLNEKNLWFFTLNFAPKDAKKIAYAPSLGVNELTESQQKEFSCLLEGMNAISLREKSGVDAIQALTDKKVSLVLDPTLLMGRNLWDKVLSKSKVPSNENYCLVYLLGTTKLHRDICEKVAHKNGLKILNFAHFKAYNQADEDLSGDKLYDVSPSEFIGLIQNAKFVITDSFHCSVFSMMYHVPFMTLLRFQNKDKMSTNTRIYSMLEQFGLQSRILDTEDKMDEIINTPIDFEYVERQLELKRIESNTFLNEALK